MHSVNASSPGNGLVPSDTISFPVRLPGGERFFFRPADPEQILNTLTDDQFERDEQLPYWAEHWPAAEAAAAYMGAHPFPSHWTVYELGCGLGVVATIIGEHCTVVASDIAYRACAYARANLLTHHIPPRIVCADWRDVPLRAGAVDAVVGSDILYEERWVKPVLDVLRYLLRIDGEAYVADPCRRHWPRFLEGAREEGMHVTLVHRTVTNAGRTSVEIARLTNTRASRLHT